MKLVATGTFRSRMRINLILFEIAGPWRERSWRWEFDPERDDYHADVEVLPGLKLWGAVEKGRINLGARVNSSFHFTLWSHEIKASPRSESFYKEPLKGVILRGTIAIEA